MAVVLPTRWRYRLMRWGWPPQSPSVRRGMYLIAAAVVLLVLQGIVLLLRLPGSGALQFSVITVTLLGVLFLTIAVFGFVRQKLLWRLRNRLIVTYVFIGVIPAILLVAMTSIAFYLFAGQFANFVVTADINNELKSLETTNVTVAHSLASRLRHKDASAFTLLEDLRASKQMATPREVCAWLDDKPLAVSSTASAVCPMTVPSFLPTQFREVVIDHGALHLLTGTTMDVGGKNLRVVGTLPLDQNLLDRVSGGLGQITLYALVGSTHQATPPNGASEAPLVVWDGPGKSTLSMGSPKKPGITFTDTENGKVIEGTLEPLLTAGVLPDPTNRLDNEIRFGSPLLVLNLDNGEHENRAALGIRTRPTLLYRRLFAALGDAASFAEGLLIASALLLAVIVVLALFIGSRLTRTMTRSVANLYTATQHMNRGDFSHRIDVRERDQLATLQTSFNSMAASLEKLMVEQREKQRLENEITIAQEVQAQLFPRQVSQLESLEVHGFCKPARTVSGDYYDFLPVTAGRLGLAVGDISGKGISAALLMATIHSAVRAYMLEGVPSPNAPQLVGAGSSRGSNGHFHGSEISPAALMSMMNRQLYSTTPMEKYATLFLALYDGPTRNLTYSNAGHLPPLLIGEDGSVRRLETGGTVVGLFDDVKYEEASVVLESGEIFLAYSDGVTEPENDYGEFGEERLIDLVRSNRHLPLERISELVTNAVYEWIGESEQPDDITLVLARAR